MLDNGPELISRFLEDWELQHAVALHFIEPCKPVQNALCEIRHGRLHDECFNEQWFHAQRIVETWRQDDHHARPYSARDYQTPAEFAQGVSTAECEQPNDDGLSQHRDHIAGAGHLKS